VSQEQLIADLAGNGVEGYYKKLGERYRYKYHEMQRQFISL